MKLPNLPNRIVLDSQGEIHYIVGFDAKQIQTYYPNSHYILQVNDGELALYAFGSLETPNILLQAERNQLLDFHYLGMRVDIKIPQMQYIRELQSWHRPEQRPITLHDPSGNEVAKTFYSNMPRQEEEKHLLKTLKGIYKTYTPPTDFPGYLILARPMADCNLQEGSYILFAEIRKAWQATFQVREDLGAHSHGRLLLADYIEHPKYTPSQAPPIWRNGDQCHGYVIALLPTEKTWPDSEDEL